MEHREGMVDFEMSDSDMLRGLTEYPVSLPVAMAHLCDNGFDSGARKITAQVVGDDLVVEDDGSGVVNVASMTNRSMHLSPHVDGPFPPLLGRYGYGFRQAGHWLSDEVTIETRHAGMSSLTRIVWNVTEELHNSDFTSGIPYPDPGPSYTRLTFSEICDGRLDAWKTLANDLAQTFTPGLQGGLRISIDGLELVPTPRPTLTDVLKIEQDFGGRHFRLTAGIRSNARAGERCGYDVQFAHRFIRIGDSSEEAFGHYNFERFSGHIELLDDGRHQWDLSVDKECFTERWELYQALYPVVEGLLKRASEK